MIYSGIDLRDPRGITLAVDYRQDRINAILSGDDIGLFSFTVRIGHKEFNRDSLRDMRSLYGELLMLAVVQAKNEDESITLDEITKALA